MKRAKKVNQFLQKAIHMVVCEKHNHLMHPEKDFTRKRKMSMQEIIQMLLSMEGGSIQKELAFFSDKKKEALTASAFVQQRSKIKSSAFEALLRSYNSFCKPLDIKRHKGYRVIAVDGSDIPLPFNPKTDTYIHQPGAKGHNSLHLNALYDVCNKTFIDAILRTPSKANEQDALIHMLNRTQFEEKTVVIMDRGYEAYNVFAHFLNNERTDLVCRLRHGNGSMRFVQSLPWEELDQDVEFEITTSQTKDDTKNNRIFIKTGSKTGKKLSPKTRVGRWDFSSPYRMRLRVVRFQLDSGEYETIATTLPREIFSISDIKELYHMRWAIETSFRDLKYRIGLVNFHSKKDELLRQEIFSAIIMYNYCSRIAVFAIIANRKETVYAYKVNFAMAIHLCRSFYRNAQHDILTLLQSIGRHSEPVRPDRHDPRNLIRKGFTGFIYRVAA